MVTRFISKYADTRLKTDLLFFWSRHPYTKFTLGVVARALGYTRRADVEKALEVLVAAELLEKHTQQGLPFYCLTTDPQKREPILREMAENYCLNRGGKV